MLGVYKDDIGHFYHYMMHVLFCISWYAMTPVIFSLKLNLNITQLEYTVYWYMVPLNRHGLCVTTGFPIKIFIERPIPFTDQ